MSSILRQRKLIQSSSNFKPSVGDYYWRIKPFALFITFFLLFDFDRALAVTRKKTWFYIMTVYFFNYHHSRSL